MLEEGGSLMNNDHVGMSQSILSQGAQPGTKLWLGIDERLSCGLWHPKGILDSTDKFIMIDISSSNQVDIVSHIIFVVVFLDHVSADSLHVLDVSQYRQPYLLLLEDASV